MPHPVWEVPHCGQEGVALRWAPWRARELAAWRARESAAWRARGSAAWRARGLAAWRGDAGGPGLGLLWFCGSGPFPTQLCISGSGEGSWLPPSSRPHSSTAPLRTATPRGTHGARDHAAAGKPTWAWSAPCRATGGGE
ncbi:hypothetical protein FKM82_029240 [Ascaphus truei]